MPDFDFDLAVIASGPAGHHATIQGAKLRKRVIMIERKALVGGVCINIGTIPSKTMRKLSSTFRAMLLLEDKASGLLRRISAATIVLAVRDQGHPRRPHSARRPLGLFQRRCNGT